MNERKLTTPAEAGCYLAAHVIGYVIGFFWNPFLLAYVRQNFGAGAFGVVLMINSAVFIFMVMFLFLFAQKFLAQQDARLTSAPEAGAYLLAHVIGYTIAAAWSPFLVRLLLQGQGTDALPRSLWPYIFFVNAMAIVLIVMVLFLLLRKHLPRSNQVLFSFAGRNSRFEYWMYYVVPISIPAIIIWAAVVIASNVPASASYVPAFASALWMWPIFLLWPSLAASVKRSHDRDRSGWFVLVGLIPIVALWPFIELGFLRGTIGPNRFGPDPVPEGERTAAVAGAWASPRE